MNMTRNWVRVAKGPVVTAALVVLALSLVGGVATALSAARSWPSESPVTVEDTMPAPATACARKPTIVLVHGAWANAASWNGEIDRLQHDGYVVRAFANPLRGLTSDSATLADFLATISGPIVRWATPMVERSSRTPPPATPMSRNWSMLTPPRPR